MTDGMNTDGRSDTGAPPGITDSGMPRPVLAQAKNIDHTPDITSDEYWDTHDIAIVRVTDVVPAERNRKNVRHQVVTRVSEAPIEAERVTPARHLWFGGAAQTEPHVDAGESLVLFSRREGSAPVAAVRIGASPEQAAFVNRLQRIARLRAGEGGLPALREAVFDPERDIALYSLKRLLKLPPVDADAAFLQRLRGLREDEHADPDVRVFAARLRAASGQAGAADDEFSWLARALSNPAAHDWTRLRGFALRLLEFPTRRAEVATLLTSIVRDATKPQDARIAAYSVFEDPRLFDAAQLDAVSNQVFETVEWMLRSPDAFLRAPAAMLLHNLARKTTAKAGADYLGRGRAAVGSALATETDEASARTMKRSLDLLSTADPRG